MTSTTTRQPAAEEQTQPPDIEALRATVRRLLGPDGAPETNPPAGNDLVTVTATLRRHMHLMVPVVEQVAGRLDKEDIPRYCALACVGEAHGKLRATPPSGPGGDIAYARKLARSLNALCDHYENLSSTPRATR